MSENPYYLMAPGPVQMPEEVLKELAKPMIHHRTPEFDAILNETFSLLKTFFRTEQKVYIQTATGSGGMESALVNTCSPGDKIIAIVSGKFGERWRDMAKALGLNVITHNVEWGYAALPNDLKQLLDANPDTKVVMTQVCETSTATLHPIKELAEVVQKYPECLFMVDAITGLGVVDLQIENWGLDVVVAGSQKAFMIPTGLCFLTFSKKAWKSVQTAKLPRFYWDIRSEDKTNQKGETHFSSSVTLIRALRVALKMMLKEGLDKQIQRTEAMAKATRVAGEILGCSPFSKSPSPSVTALNLPANIDGNTLRNLMESEKNITIAGGQDHLKGKIVRIGHLGYINKKETLATIEALADILNSLGHVCDKDTALSKAAKELEGI